MTFYLNRHRRSLIAALLSSGAILAGADAAQAQSSANETTVGEVVVTAERRDRNLQTSAISATVLTADQLSDKGVVDIQTLQAAAPNVVFSDFGATNAVNIRGLGRTADGTIDLNSGVAIYRDGLPTLASFFQNAPYYDIASIEVLRGPQGTFVGKAASAGAVFIRTANPTLGDFGGSVLLGAGNHDAFEANAVVNAPLGDTLAVRLAFNHQQRDPLYKSITSNNLPGQPALSGEPDKRNITSLRLGVRWRPIDAFDAVFKLDLDDVDTGGQAPVSIGAPLRRPVINGDIYQKDESARLVGDLKYELANGIRLSSLSGWQYVDTRQSMDLNAGSPGISTLRYVGKVTVWTQEFNVVSPDDQRFRWLGGLFLQRLITKIPAFDGFSGTMASPFVTTPYIKHEDDWALFGQVSFDLTDALELEVGGRYGGYDLDHFTNYKLFGIAFEAPAGRTIKYSENKFDWKINLNWALNDAHFFYGLVSRGHTPGGLNLSPELTPGGGGPLPFKIGTTHTIYRPMEVTNFEAGWKATLLQGRLRTQLAVFHQVFDDFQVLAFDPLFPPASVVPAYINIDSKSTIDGAEFALQADVNAWEFDLALGYLDTELGSKTLLNEFRTPPGLADVKGEHTTMAPRWTASLGVARTFKIGELEIRPRADVAYRDHSYASIFNSPRSRIAGHTVLNLQVRLEHGPWFATAYANNATDEHYVAAILAPHQPPGSQPGVSSLGSVFPGAPRTLGVRIGREF